MESLWLMLPATLILAGTLVAMVVRAARRGDYEDWEGPAARLLHDDDSLPEVEGAAPDESPPEPARSAVRDRVSPARKAPGRP